MTAGFRHERFAADVDIDAGENPEVEPRKQDTDARLQTWVSPSGTWFRVLQNGTHGSYPKCDPIRPLERYPICAIPSEAGLLVAFQVFQKEPFTGDNPRNTPPFERRRGLRLSKDTGANRPHTVQLGG